MDGLDVRQKMMNTKTISETVLRGITVALDSHAPQLIGIIKDMVQSNATAGSSGGFGQSVYGALTGSIPPDQGREISEALHKIQRLHGDCATFDGRQINYLILEWDQFALPGALPLQ